MRKRKIKIEYFKFEKRNEGYKNITNMRFEFVINQNQE